jgi:peptidoglycan/xylan/chitin deacetylase (PgdA/CDA1 family)/trans-aconitate methyltransferase
METIWPATDAVANDRGLAQCVDEARREGELAAGPAPSRMPLASRRDPESHRDRASFWEAFFERPDPWNYGSDYERLKYERQLSLLPDVPIGRALELGCAEGSFTRLLADRVEHLTAADISGTALERARACCAQASNVSFEKLDFVVDPIPQGLDLIVCSEFLYYLESEEELLRACRKLVAALRRDGLLLMAHPFLLKDDRSRTGFDWDQPFGAMRIALTMAQIPQIALERSLQTELYRIDLYRRVEEAATSVEPLVETLPVGAALEPKVRRDIVWGGATALRCELKGSTTTGKVPILLYHRIAGDGPPELARYRVAPERFSEQMQWLRREGFHAISCSELRTHLESFTPFAGRPVLITFDDGAADFAETAWPVMQDCALFAEVFVVTDLVGQSAYWDNHYGDPARLMTRDEIVALSREGVNFGSHLATHSAVDHLSSRGLAAELARSRAMLEVWSGRPVEAVAAPFGIVDERYLRLAHACGYRIGMTTEPGIAGLGDAALRLPRVEVRGDWRLDDFRRAVEAARQ